MLTSEASSLLLPWVSEERHCGRRCTTAAPTLARKDHAQIAFDRRLSCARHRSALDRSGHRRDRLAAVELHDQPYPVGRLRRGACRFRSGPDLAGQTLREIPTMKTEPFDLGGKVAIVTGGNGGIGLGMAQGLAEAGAGIAIVGRNEAKSAAAVAELKQAGAKAISITADVTDNAAVTDMVECVRRELGRIDILVNNAGINIRKS